MAGAPTSTAWADFDLCPPGSGAGQCNTPEGLATDFETDRLYVADRGNNRINVFKASSGEFLFSFGSPGSGAGQLSSPRSIAVDNVAASPTKHDVYVTDSNFRVNHFEADGTFVNAFGWGVDTGAPELESCTTASGCQAGLQGGGECQLSGSEGGVPLAIGPAGNVFTAVTSGNEPNFTARVEKFSPEGACLGETVLATGNRVLLTLAVNSNEDAYVSVGRLGNLELRKYDLAAPETELCKVDPDPGIFTIAVALDDAGYLFAAQGERDAENFGAFQVITEYDVSSCPPTKHVRRFGYGELSASSTGIAALHTAAGDVFASQGAASSVKYFKYPPAGPIAPEEGLEVTRRGSANADVSAEINPEGKATTYHFEYVEESQFEINGFTEAQSTETKELIPPEGKEFRVNAVEGLLACPKGEEEEINKGECLTPETKYRWRIVSSNADGPGLGTAEGPPFETKAPLEIEDLWAMEVGTDAATLAAVVNPVGSNPTTGHFEYVTEDQFKANEFDEAVSAPVGAELNFGGGEGGSKRIATLYPLAPGTVYHYRIAATNPVLKASSTADFLFSAPKTFRTFDPRGPPQPCPNDAFRIGPATLLPDCRAYELVSPLDKANGDIKVLGEFATLLPATVNQSDTSGERLTYGSYRAFADTLSAPYTSQYLATRDPAEGWTAHAINPPQDGSIKGSLLFDNEYRFFSEDLCEAWMTPFFEPALAEGAIAGFFNLYRRTELCEEGTEAYEAITTAKPLAHLLPQSENSLYLLEPQGHSADGSVNAFAANDSLEGTLAPPQPSGEGGCGKVGKCRFALYVKGEGLGAKPRFACLLPGGVPIGGGENCTAGTFNSTAGLGAARSPNVTGALSEDGKRLFWSRWTGDSNPDTGKIYLRENPLATGTECSGPAAPCTREVSKGGEVLSGSTGAHFWQAAPDGSAALYTTGGDLYRYIVATQTSVPIAGGVLGLVGASEDTERVYFASEEVLTGGEENEAGQEAEAGKANLYLQEAGEGGGYRFIGQLAQSDLGIPGFFPTSPILPQPVNHNGRVSPSGLAASFMSAGPMTGYDNTDAISGKADTEVFVYDATAEEGAGELVCASCSLTNGRPLGADLAGAGGTNFWVAGRIPASYSTLAEPEVLAPDGSRLFFESTEALVADDTNGRLDVYQWERAGQGSCNEGEPTFSAAAGGCVDLISSGQSLADSEIVDASQSAVGADVFFNTLEGLLPQDYGLRDIYDARIGGGFVPPPPPTPECEGESCQSPPAAPERQTGATATNVGPGNVWAPKKPKRCPKGKHRVKKGGKVRCVPNKRKGSNKAKGKRQGRAAG